ncbi:MAG: formylglycine-generating enzyme family protein [Myxococcota bacterium]
MIPEALLLSNRMPEIEARLARELPSERAEIVKRMEDRIADPGRPLIERISAGNVLGLLGDPRIDPLRPQMCPVPLGPFWMGLDESEVSQLARRYAIPEGWLRKSTPRHRVELDAFEIARFPITEAEYHRFLRETGSQEAPSHWRAGAPPPYRANHPVRGVSWHGALLYAEWLSERTGRHYRIPTEAEWEKAARGSDARSFPWGDRFEPHRCNTREGGVGTTTPVGLYLDGSSPYGALDMAGNVEELTADLYGPYPGTGFDDSAFGSYRVTRGGVFCLDADLARCDRRHGEPFSPATGFRLVRSAADEWLGR